MKKQLKQHMKQSSPYKMKENNQWNPNGMNGLFDVFSMRTKQLSKLETLETVIRGNLITNNRNLLNHLYVENGIIQAICEVPVFDAFRGGVNITTDNLSPEEQADLLAEIDERDDIGALAESYVWSRLFGGGAVMVVTDQDPWLPLELEKLKGQPLSFVSVDLWELNASSGMDANGQPTSDWDAEFYYWKGKKFHNSRVIKVKGVKAPSLLRPRTRGWGVSVVETLVRSINQFLKTTDLTFEVLDEFKLDIFKVNGFNQHLMTPKGKQVIQDRVQMANMQKNYQNALMMDAQDDYEQKNLNFAGIAEVMRSNKEQIAADLRMPITKIFGTSVGGMGSGQDEIMNYNAMVESMVRQKAKFIVMRMVKIRAAQQFGIVLDNIKVEFKPLEVIPENIVEEVKDKKFNRLVMAFEKGIIDAKTFMEACNKENLLPIQIDEDDVETILAKSKAKEKEDGSKDGNKGGAGKNPEGSGKGGNNPSVQSK